ncbi:hypothetical protein VSR68_04240 [Paraburkholderia phymatum]|uniref:hypothetical protein n=1 Tax=Paraburkholderia phymatum TaxID=148447 RepID=UPI00316E4B44
MTRVQERHDKALARVDRADAGIIEADYFKSLPEPCNRRRPTWLTRIAAMSGLRQHFKSHFFTWIGNAISKQSTRTLNKNNPVACIENDPIAARGERRAASRKRDERRHARREQWRSFIEDIPENNRFLIDAQPRTASALRFSASLIVFSLRTARPALPVLRDDARVIPEHRDLARAAPIRIEVEGLPV